MNCIYWFHFCTLLSRAFLDSFGVSFYKNNIPYSYFLQCSIELPFNELNAYCFIYKIFHMTFNRAENRSGRDSWQVFKEFSIRPGYPNPNANPKPAQTWRVLIVTCPNLHQWVRAGSLVWQVGSVFTGFRVWAFIHLSYNVGWNPTNYIIMFDYLKKSSI